MNLRLVYRTRPGLKKGVLSAAISASLIKQLHINRDYATLPLEATMTNIITSLKQSDIFYQLSQTQLQMVAHLCKEVTFQTGDVIFQENSDSKELYIIVQGEVDIIIRPSKVSLLGLLEEEEAPIATLRRGQNFGEVALVDGGLRSATARATQDDTRLLVIERDRLINLCETYPQLGYRLMYNLSADLAMKIRNTDLRIREQLLYKPQEDKK